MTRRLARLAFLLVVVNACSAVPPAREPSPTSAPSGAGSAAPTAMATVTAAPTSTPTIAPPSPSAAPSPLAGPCRSDVDMGVLPTWAREGFADPEQVMPHVLSRSGDVVAIVFGFPLAAPARDDPANKILWVHREGATSPVEISAQRMEGTAILGEAVGRRLDDGFGPSILDLPDAGCWRLTMTYGDRSDSIDLEYIGAPAG